MDISMILGERRRVKFCVTSEANEDFAIEDARYSLIRGLTVEQTGVPVVEGHEMTVEIEPRAKGGYTLELKFEVAGELLIRRTIVSVRE